MKFDVNDLFQYLIPIIFLVVWLFGKIFSPKRSEETDLKGKSDRLDDELEEVFSFDKEITEYIDQPIEEPVSEAFSQDINVREGIRRSEKVKILKRKYNLLGELIDSEKLSKDRRRSEVIALLRGPNALKKAYLSYEILGPPLCLRKNGKMGRSWQR